jgi:mono/diheme cytochrome c family protein
MKKLFFILLTVSVSTLVIVSCKKDTQPTPLPADPCANVSISISTTNTAAVPCTTANGTITVTASGSNGFTYAKNGGTYQTSNIFSGLAAGSYTITVKDSSGCTKSQTATVGTASPGTNFSNVQTIVNTKCSGCHTGGGNDGGANFDNYCSIVTKWDRINIRCVSQGNMPPSGLNATQKAQITAWINAGHQYNN